MPQHRLLSTGDVCRLLSTKQAEFPRKTLDNWCRQGMIRPAVDNGGAGNHRVFNFLPDVLAIVLGRGLRAKGFSLKVAGDIVNVVMAYDGETLLKKFAKGECYLMLVDDEVCPQLFTKATVDATMRKYAPGALSIGLQPIVIDIGHLYDNMNAELARQHDQDRPSAKLLAKRG